MTLADLIAGGESLTVEFKKDVCDHDLVEAVVASRADVFEALAGFGVTFTNPLPTGAAGARSVSDVAALHRRMRRAFQLARTLPDALIRAVESETANLPRSTEYVSCLISKRSAAPSLPEVGLERNRDGAASLDLCHCPSPSGCTGAKEVEEFSACHLA